MAEFDRRYPQGRLSGEDEGTTQYGIAADQKNKRVLIQFFKPVYWFGMDFEAGLNLVMSLAKKLSTISGYTISVRVEEDRSTPDLPSSAAPDDSE